MKKNKLMLILALSTAMAQDNFDDRRPIRPSLRTIVPLAITTLLVGSTAAVGQNQNNILPTDCLKIMGGRKKQVSEQLAELDSSAVRNDACMSEHTLLLALRENEIAQHEQLKIKMERMLAQIETLRKYAIYACKALCTLQLAGFSTPYHESCKTDCDKELKFV